MPNVRSTQTRPLAQPIHSFNAVRRLQSPRLRIPLRSAELSAELTNKNKMSQVHSVRKTTFVTAFTSGVARIGTPCGR